MLFFTRITIFIFVVLSFISLASCKKKYPEGGSFSLLSKKSRIVNSWKIYAVLLDGKDSTAPFIADHYKYNLVMNQDGTYALMYYSGNATITEAGKWSLINEKARVSFEHMGGRYEWEILKLKNKEWWVNDSRFYGVKTELQFIPY